VEKHVEKGMLLTTEYMLSHGHAAGGVGGAAEERHLSK
jgi:hypothetical protein